VCVEQWHVDYSNVYAPVFRQYAPLILYFFVVSPQTVDAFDIKHVAGLKLFYKRPIKFTIKVFAALLVRKNPLRWYTEPAHCEQLAIFILILT